MSVTEGDTINYSDAYKQIMKSRGYTQRELAAVIGIAQGSLSCSLKEGNPTLSTAGKYLQPLGYKLALVPVGSRLPDGSVVIDQQ